MSKSEGIGAIIGSFIGCIVSAVFNVFIFPSIWFAVIPLAGYIIGSWIGKSINNSTK